MEVVTAGVNRADLLQRRGKYPPPAGVTDVLGLEIAGRVLSTGEGVTSRPGRQVMAVVSGGGYATRCTVPEEHLLDIPDGMNWIDAGAVPEAFLTAWLNLHELGGLQAGETVLLHAGASGVGTAAIQIARELGARVLTTAGSPEKLDLCRRLGAHRAIHRHEEDFVRVVEHETDGRGVDLVVDVVGAPYWERNTAAVARGGRLVLVGFLGGSRGDLDLGPILRKSLTVRGTTLRGRSREAKATLVASFAEFGLPRLADGRLRAVVDRALPLGEAAEAHRALEANATAGKIVLVASPTS